MIIAQKIKELRKEKKLSQKDISQAINVTISCVSYWENEIYEPTATNIVKLANFFCVSSDYLLGIE